MNDWIKNCKFFSCALLIGIIAALFSFTHYGTYLEEEFGLPWLFKFRGVLQPSGQVVIVSVDKLSAEILRLPDNPEKWPRSYYAQLIGKLNQQNPSVIALNMTFGESRGEEDDQLLAQAMAKGKNIVLSNYIKQSVIYTGGLDSSLKYEQIINPLPIFEHTALVTAPFPLPKTASTVNQFWTYKNSAGGIATFPVAVFQCFIFKHAYSEILQLLYLLDHSFAATVPPSLEELLFESNVADVIHDVETIIKKDFQSLEKFEQLIKASAFSDDKKRLLTNWLALLKMPNSLFFNHYGSAGTITTIPFYQALMSDILNPELFKNKIVLVGYSEDIEPEKNQGFYTVFSTTDSEITSPIEIAATAVSNLIDKTWLQQLALQDQFLLVLGWSVFLFAVCRFFSYKLAISLVLVSNVLYLLIAYKLFYTSSIWVPLFTPVLILTPVVLTFKTITFFIKGKQERQLMEEAFSLYIPNNVVSSLKQHHDVSAMNHYGELMSGVCMATDAEQYTKLSENMKPEKLNELMNQYYSVIFPLVKKYNGIITDVIGDAMFAVWPATDQENKAKMDACLAAVEIKKAVDQFNATQLFQLPTRIGLHFGEIRLGNVGAADHFEYRAIGDTVNSATRIEGLNKFLGTKILVSTQVNSDIFGFNFRDVGFFVLKGKTQPIHVFELMTITQQRRGDQTIVVSRFIKALKLFQQQQWAEALYIWLEIERLFPGDGPTLFYIRYLKHELHLLSEQTDLCQPTVIRIGNITTSLAFNNEMGIE